MGKLYDSLLSGSSGKIGRLVVANLFGTEILRKRPRKRTAAPTDKQLLVQQRMKRSYDFILPYKEFAREYFGKRIGMKSPYNQAMTTVINAFKLNFVTMQVEPAYAEIDFARGSLMAPLPTGLSSLVANTFKLDWFDNSGGDPVRQTDQLQVLFIANDEAKPVLMENMSLRPDATVEIPVSAQLSGKTIHVWITFRAADHSAVANSSYAGTVLIT